MIKYVSPWGRHHFSVLGLTDSYTVFPNLPHSSVPHFCTCPAFAYAVLISQSQLVVRASLFPHRCGRRDDLFVSSVNTSWPRLSRCAYRSASCARWEKMNSWPSSCNRTRTRRDT